MSSLEAGRALGVSTRSFTFLVLRTLVCAQVFLLTDHLTAGQDGSSPKAHPSQTDKSMSEHGPRIVRAADTVEGDRFGRAVALGPDLALIGADSAPCAQAEAGGECHASHCGPGAVYVFGKDWVDEAVGGYSEAGYRVGSRWWGLRRKLTPPDGIRGQRFGAVVSLCPVMHTAAVGAPLRPVTGASQSLLMCACALECHEGKRRASHHIVRRQERIGILRQRRPCLRVLRSSPLRTPPNRRMGAYPLRVWQRHVHS